MGWSRFIHGINYYDPKKGLPPSPTPEPTTGECATCGHIVAIQMMHEVTLRDYSHRNLDPASNAHMTPIRQLYCANCRVPYDEKEVPSVYGRTYGRITRYWKRMEVDELGKPLESK